MGLVKPSLKSSKGYNTYMSKRVMPTRPVVGLMDSGYGSILTLLKTDQKSVSEEYHRPRLGTDGCIYQDILGSNGTTLIRSVKRVDGTYARLTTMNGYFIGVASGLYVFFDYNYQIIASVASTIGITENSYIKNKLFLTIPNSNELGTVRNTFGTILFTLSSYSVTSMSYAIDLGDNIVLAYANNGSQTSFYLLDLGNNPREIDKATGTYINATNHILKLLGGNY